MKKADVRVVLSEGFARPVAVVAVSRQCRARCGGQTGREPRPPDGTRDNNGLSRHRYLLQPSTGTTRWTLSRESHTKLLRGLRLARGKRLARVWAETGISASLGCRLQPPRSLAGLDPGCVTDEQIPFFHIFTWCI